MGVGFYKSGVPGLAQEVAEAAEYADQASELRNETQEFRNEAEEFASDAEAAAAAAAASDRIISLPTVAAMAAAPSLQAGNVVDTEGYSASGDGGGNRYLIGSGFGAADGGSVIDLAGSGLQARGLFVGGIVNAAQFGALDNGLDVSNSLQNAINYADEKIIFPSGQLRVSSTIVVSDKYLDFKSANIIWLGSGSLFHLKRSGIDTACYGFFNCQLNTSTIGTSTAIYVEQTDIGVRGGSDVLIMEDVRIDAEGSGYWQVGLRVKNTGGVYFSNVTIRNNNNPAAQVDMSTKGVHIECETGSNVIRALHAVNFYIQRYHYGIHAETENTVESVYLNNYEVVTHIGAYYSGSGSVDAVGFGIGHIDCIGGASIAECDFNLARFTGADFRMGSNGESAQSGDLISVVSGEVLNISGCTLSGNESANPVLLSAGVRIGGNYNRAAVGDNVFRNLESGIIIEGAASLINTGVNTFGNVNARYTVIAPSLGNSTGRSETLTDDGSSFSGDLDDLAKQNAGQSFRRLTAGISNAPPIAVGAGSICQTFVWNVDSAIQLIKVQESDVTWSRSKDAGVWGNWRNISYPSYEATNVIELAGGASTEVVSLDISSGGFSAKPGVGFCQCLSPGFLGHYDYSASTATTAFFTVEKSSGAAIPAGARRFYFRLSN